MCLKIFIDCIVLVITSASLMINLGSFLASGKGKLVGLKILYGISSFDGSGCEPNMSTASGNNTDLDTET